MHACKRIYISAHVNFTSDGKSSIRLCQVGWTGPLNVLHNANLPLGVDTSDFDGNEFSYLDKESIQVIATAY